MKLYRMVHLPLRIWPTSQHIKYGDGPTIMEVPENLQCEDCPKCCTFDWPNGYATNTLGLDESIDLLPTNIYKAHPKAILIYLYIGNMDLSFDLLRRAVSLESVTYGFGRGLGLRFPFICSTLFCRQSHWKFNCQIVGYIVFRIGAISIICSCSKPQIRYI